MKLTSLYLLPTYHEICLPVKLSPIEMYSKYVYSTEWIVSIFVKCNCFIVLHVALWLVCRIFK